MLLFYLFARLEYSVDNFVDNSHKIVLFSLGIVRNPAEAFLRRFKALWVHCGGALPVLVFSTFSV